MIHVRTAGMVVSVLRAVLLVLIAAMLLPAQTRVRLGGVTVGASYTHGPGWWGPGLWNPYWGPRMWTYYQNPLWYGPWIHPGYMTGFAFGPGMGEVKLKSPSADATVLIDGAYAGEARKLKSIWLEPGVYNLEVRDDADASFSRRIYVLSGKTLQIQAKLQLPGKDEGQK